MKSNKKIAEVIESINYIDDGFIEILDLSRHCKFSDCTHTTETDCAVKDAISDGSLSEERLNSYFKEKGEAEYVCLQRNKTKAIDYMKQRKLFIRK